MCPSEPYGHHQHTLAIVSYCCPLGALPQTYANTQLVQHAVQLRRLSSSDMPRVLDSCIRTAASRSGPGYDTGGSDGSQLVGAGQRLPIKLALQLLAALC